MEKLCSPVLNCEDVRKLIDIRCHLPSRSYVTIKGCITSMSEILRMKCEDFFLVELDCQVYILVKDFHLDWHQQMCPLTTVVFHNLRLTTIEKGVAKSQSILMAWKTSQITVEPKSKDISVADYKEWLANTDLALPTTDPKYKIFNSVNSTIKYHHLQGTVTDASRSADGIFVLDNKIRLFTGFIPSGGFDATIITEGCTLQVYNIHSLQDSENTLVACSHSLIRCAEHNVSSRRKKDLCNPSKKKCGGLPVNSFIHKYAFNFIEAQAFLTLQQHLGGSDGKNVSKILDSILKSEVCGNIAAADVSPIDLFIHHDRLCQMSDNHMSRNRIPVVQSVCQLKDLCLKRHKETAIDRPKYDERSLHWSVCQHWEDKKILLGTLSVSLRGQLVFVDTTGEIPVVLFSNCINEENKNPIHTASLGEKNESEHKRSEMTCHCCDFKCLKAVGSKENPPCPFVSQGMIGKTLIIQRFQLISERLANLACSQQSSFDSHINISEMKSSETSELLDISPLTYLLVCLQDCLMLENTFSKPSVIVDCENFQSVSYRDQAGPLSRFIGHMDEYDSCLIHISGKESITATAFGGYNFKMNGSLINVDAWEEFLVEGKCLNETQSKNYLCGTKLEENCLNKRKRSADLVYYKPPTPKAEVNTVKCYLLDGGSGAVREVRNDDRRQRYEKSIFTSNGKLPQSAMKDINSAAAGSGVNAHSLIHDTQPVTLFISGEAITSHPFLNVDNFYVLKIPVNKENAFKPVFSNGKVEEALWRSNSRVFIDMKDKFAVEKAVMNAALLKADAAPFGLETCRLLTVVGALNQRDTESIVSFRGVITAREALTPTFSIKGISGSDDIKLTVRDLNEGKFHIHVYFKSFKACDVLGLIPGAVVDFYGVERKVSQQGNVYCKFGATASFYLQRFIRDCNFDTGGNANLKNLRVDCQPREYLFNIWHLEANDCVESQLLWSINCHICMIFNLNLKVVCSLCQGVFLKNGCQSRGCKNSDAFHVKAQAIVLVDDSTSQASVRFFKQKLVQRLLTLTDEQWSDLISEVQESGEILVSRCEPSVSCPPVERFLYQLIQSPLVVRTCLMAVRRMKNSPSSSTVAKMNLQDFKVKDTNFGKGSVPVLQLPLMQVECLDLKEAPR